MVCHPVKYQLNLVVLRGSADDDVVDWAPHNAMHDPAHLKGCSLMAPQRVFGYESGGAAVVFTSGWLVGMVPHLRCVAELVNVVSL